MTASNPVVDHSERSNRGSSGRRFIGVSLKMYLDHEETLEWCEQVAQLARSHKAILDGSVQLVVFPSFPSLLGAARILKPAGVSVGGQNLHAAAAGAFTGEVSGSTLHQVGCEFVEVGHAERRRLFGETNADIAAKFAAALRAGLIPVLCVGEESRVPALDAIDACIAQLQSALAAPSGNPFVGDLVVAYEPEWAIGASEPASADHIRSVCIGMREWLDATLGGRSVKIIYGGSAGPGLLASLGEEVSGLFMGRNAHDPRSLGVLFDEALQGEIAE